MSDSVQPHRRQPTRLPRPWDSPGKNTAVGCHFPLQCRKVKSESEVAQSCPTLSNPMDCSPPGFSIHGIFQAKVLEWGAIAFSLHGLQHARLLCPWDFPGRSPGVGAIAFSETCCYFWLNAFQSCCFTVSFSLVGFWSRKLADLGSNQSCHFSRLGQVNQLLWAIVPFLDLQSRDKKECSSCGVVG